MVQLAAEGVPHLAAQEVRPRLCLHCGMQWRGMTAHHMAITAGLCEAMLLLIVYVEQLLLVAQ